MTRTKALSVDDLRNDFEAAKQYGVSRPRFSTEEIGALFAEIERLRALSAPAAPIVPEGWLPIETAPQDMGAYLFRVNGIAVDGFRDATGKMCVRNEQHEWRAMHGKPTHWMPLPAAPQPGAPTPKGAAHG